MIAPTVRSRSARRALPSAAGAVLLLATGCAGPVAPLEIGMNTRAVNLLLGERLTVVTQGPPPVVPVGVAPPLPPSSPGDLSVLPPPPPQPPLELPPILPPDIPPGPCPAAAPDAALLNLATRTITLPPAPAKYTYRTTGGVFAAKPDPSNTKFPLAFNVATLPQTTTREVTNVEREVGTKSYLYDVVTTMDVMTGTGKKTQKKSTATYRIVPEWTPASPPQQIDDNDGLLGARSKPGLYLMRVDSPSGTFVVPEPGLKLVELPIQLNASFQTAGTDGSTTMSYTSTVNRDQPKVDACGELIDAFQIDLKGTISQPSRQTDGVIIGNFTASYAIAPQFGGLIVQEATDVTSDANGVPLAKRTLNATINRVPEKPKAPGDGG